LVDIDVLIVKDRPNECTFEETMVSVLAQDPPLSHGFGSSPFRTPVKAASIEQRRLTLLLLVWISISPFR
jgi:hypothetical protein